MEDIRIYPVVQDYMVETPDGGRHMFRGKTAALDAALFIVLHSGRAKSAQPVGTNDVSA